MSRKNLAIFLFLSLPGFMFSQDYRIMIRPVDGERVPGVSQEAQLAGDSVRVYRVLKDVLGDLREKGYLAASVDSIAFDSLDVSAWVYIGPQFEWGKLSLDSLDRRVLRKAGIRQRAFSGKPVRYSRLSAVQEKLIEWYENNGYPFAGVYINNIQIPGEQISGELMVEKGDLFLIDTLHVKGELKIDHRYVERLFGIEPGDSYREDRILQIGDRIRETPFLEEIKPAEMEFFREKVDVYTYLQKARANQFNGIVGVFPNHKHTGSLLITGDLHLYLVNSFGKGESFRFAWKSLQPLTQELDVNLTWPYVFNSLVGVGVDFNLLKQDTTWFTVNPVVDLKFFFGGNNYFNVFYDYFNSSLISVTGLGNSTVLPSYADVSSSLYGLGIQYQGLDYLFNPRRGWNINARLGVGGRKIRKNPALPETVYEGIALSTTKIRGFGEICFYQPLGRSFTLLFENRSGYVFSENLFENEMFRLGGIHNLRGVDENSIYASIYSLVTIEARFLFEQNSNFFLFFDGGFYAADIEVAAGSDCPFGFGGGINLSTRAGIFSLVYALGKQFDNPINISNAKIHIGYLNRF